MKFVVGLLIAAPLFVLGGDAKPQVDWQKGRCLGGNQPSVHCKNCSTCWYCGKHGRWGARPQNSATCAVCDSEISRR